MADHEGRPASDEYAPFYGRYIDLVPAGGIVGILARQVDETVALLDALSENAAEHRYSPGKWSIKEVVGHVADGERVFAYRALRFGRGDAMALPGFDENHYVPAGHFGDRSLRSLLDELVAVRRATVALLDGLPADAWLRRGEASGADVTVRALAYMAAGHELHHRALLEERYRVRDLATRSG
jgi:uncharacterized damage-inducible protein DinB